MTTITAQPLHEVPIKPIVARVSTPVYADRREIVGSIDDQATFSIVRYLRSSGVFGAKVTTRNRSSVAPPRPNQTPIYVLAGVMIAQFQLVGRSNAERLFTLADSSPLFEFRLWILAALSCWLFVVSTIHDPATDRTERVVLAKWRNPTLLFLAYMIFTSLWAPDIELAVIKAYDLLTLAWSCTLAASAIRIFGARAMIDGFWIGVFLSCSFLAVVGVLSALTRQESGVRLAVLGGGPNVYGRNMGLLTIVSLHLAFSDRRWIRRIALITTPLSALLVLQSGSRGAMLALFVGAIIFLRLRGFDRRVVYSGILVALLAAIAFATRLGAIAALLFRERVLVLLISQRYFTHRDTLLLDGLNAGLNNPIGGLGLAGFVQLDSPGLYPHNFVVEALSEGGFVGLFLLTVPFVYYIRRWKRGMTLGHPLAVAGLGLLVVSSSISGDLFDARGVFLGLLLALVSQTPRSSNA